ncbi:MAG: iron chelate uptake ABC transporter family permease subunit [Chloroflexota bacterium]|nr:iron chelate uptake ABC transporter family permease subunit [Chloroflexota bacterium]
MPEKTAPSAMSAPAKITAPHVLRWRSRLWAMGGLLLLLAVIMAFATSVGSADISFFTVWQILLSKLPFFNFSETWTSNTETIILTIRLPRIVMAGLVGASLAVAGATYQGLFRNPLADPYLIGVSQGALLGAVIGFSIGEGGIAQFGLVPILAFVGAVIAVTIVYSIARTGKSLPVTTLILAGVALGSFLSAMTHYLMINSSNEKLQAIVFWIFGHIEDEWSQVLAVLPFMLIGTAIIWLYARPLNVMQLDEEQAQQLGINVERVKMVLLICSTLITAAAVAFCGTIGFVGIIIPHTVRLIWGPDHRFLLPLSTLVGAIFLIMADTAVRTITEPEEGIPIGVITASVGAPFFLYLLRKKRRGTFF